ncbi:glycosyltransferase [Microbacterium sp. GXF7504]
MSAPRILFVADEFLHPKHSGNRVETANEVILLSQVLGYDVHLFMPRDPWTTPELEAAHRAAVPVPTTFYDRPPRLRAMLQRPTTPYIGATRHPIGRERARMLQAARDAGPFDLIYTAHDFMWPFADDLSRSLGGVPVLIRSHNDEARFFRELVPGARNAALRCYFRWEERASRALRRRFRVRAAAVAVLSDADAGAYRGATVRYLPPLVHTGALRELPAPATPEGRDTLLFVGALDQALSSEGLEWFRTTALPLLAAQRPGTRLRVVGRGAPAELASKLHADPNVDFVGEVDDLDPEFARARVFVNPVLGGSGVNIKMGGPAASGVPIVTNRLGARGFDGLSNGIILAETPAEFAAACAQLLSDDAAWSQRSAAIAEGFAAHFSVDAVTRAYADVIAEAAGQSSSPMRRSAPSAQKS